jgi:hypothetical protein
MIRMVPLPVPRRSLSAQPRDDLDADTIEQVLRPGGHRRTRPRWTFTVLRRATPADLKAAPR